MPRTRSLLYRSSEHRCRLPTAQLAGGERTAVGCRRQSRCRAPRRAARKTVDYKFPVEQLKTQVDVLRFAAGLEQGAVSAYLGAVPLFGDRDLAKAAASILGDEAMHWAILRQALGENPVPEAFVS
jgi:hypothetical protein